MYSSIANESEEEATTNIIFYQIITMTCNIVVSVE